MGKPIFKDKVISVSGDFGGNRRPDQLRGWITQAGGEYKTTLVSSTTHLVVSEANWKKQGNAVQEALARKEVKVVTYDWLEDSLLSGRKKSEGQYQWDKIHKDVIKKRKQKEKLEAKQKKQAEKQAEKKSGNLTVEALKSHTAFYADSQEKPAVKSAGKKSRATKKSKTSTRCKGEDDFIKGAKAAKQDLLSDNHAVYMDDTGFKYEVTVVKVHSSTNINERATITLYASNTETRTYATHIKTSGSIIAPTASVEGAIGSTFYVAYRVFKKLFHEKTGVQWDQRYEYFTKPARPANKTLLPSVNRGFINPAAIVAAGGARQKGGATKMTAEQARDFEAQKFTWRRPAEGEPLGCLLPAKPEPNGYMSVEEVPCYPALQGIGLQDDMATQFVRDADEVDFGADKDSSEDFMMSGGAGPVTEASAPEDSGSESDDASDYHDVDMGQGDVGNTILTEATLPTVTENGGNAYDSGQSAIDQAGADYILNGNTCAAAQGSTDEVNVDELFDLDAFERVWDQNIFSAESSQAIQQADGVLSGTGDFIGQHADT